MSPVGDAANLSAASRRIEHLQRSLSTKAPSSVSSDIDGGRKLLQRWRESSLLAYCNASEEQLRETVRAAVGLQRRSAPGITDELLQVVMKLYSAQRTAEGKRRFLLLVCKDFGVQGDAVEAAMSAYQSAQGRSEYGEEATLRALQRLQQACQPQYTALFVPISNQPGGIKFLSDMRADVLDAITGGRDRHSAPHLRGLSNSIKASLSEWFSVGLLQLRRISWERSPAALLDKVMRYEQVHAYRQADPWGDLKARLAPGRRVFGFFHSSMPDEPLVILHTALLPRIACGMAEIFGPNGAPGKEEAEARAAVFYSISATQRGLAGIDLGKFLIKQAAQLLLQELPQLSQLSTLSPIPGFAAWLLVALDHHFSGQGIGSSIQLRENEEGVLRPLWLEAKAAAAGQPHLPLLQRRITACLQEPEAEPLWRRLLLRQAAHYLLEERRRSLALDPVANFHLRNGAEVWRLNWKAYDNQDSFGIMVNYRYVLDNITANNQAYIHSGNIAASAEVSRLLRTV